MGCCCESSEVLSLWVLVCRLGTILWKRLLLFSVGAVHEIADEGSGVWKPVREVDQTAPTVERTPCNDCKLYDLILLL